MKIQVYLCPASSFVTRIPQLKQAIKALIGKAINITVQIDDSIRHDHCTVDDRCDCQTAKRISTMINEDSESELRLGLLTNLANTSRSSYLSQGHSILMDSW